MKNSFFALGVLLAALCLLNACNDPTSIGSDLLSGDELDLAYTDTLTIRSKTVRDADSVLTYSTADFDPASFRLTAHLVGRFEDPIFGISESSVYAQVRLLNGIVPNFAQGEFLDEVHLDSIVLVLPWDTLGIYGDTLTEMYDLEVYELDESLSSDENYFSDQTFAVKPNVIAGVTGLRPRPRTPVTALQPTIDIGAQELIRERQLRLHLDPLYASAFFGADTLNFQNDTSFLKFFKGLYIKSASTNRGMLSFNLNSTSAGMYVYYKVDTLKQIYQFPFSFNPQSVRTAHFSHDYQGTIVEQALNSTSETDSIIFVQGMAGVTATLEFPFADSFNDILVNKAELELPIIHLDGDLNFDPISQLALEEVLADGTTRPISDLTIAASLGSGTSFVAAFGGVVVDEERYVINMSNHFQKMVDGEATKTVRILVLNQAAKASRSILGGAGHPEFPVKLKLAYTHL
ncbi:MAG: DUF4270 domain-containing protein [Bacteroidetes bacterium]|nr:MAG: DUF4270 domain-containing protein [Bacteroidota bacterium]